MLFNSLEFFVFFPIVVTLYFAMPHWLRWIVLLGASYYFYISWKPEYIILIIISTLVDYHVSQQMAKASIISKRKKFLLLSLFINLGLLFVFKYFNFFNTFLKNFLGYFNIAYHLPDLDLILPVGISFYTFQTLSYTIDVYRGDAKPEKDLAIFALYVSFFPQLVAGPIERSNHLLPQFRKKQAFNYEQMTDGLKLMVWGFFKKLVIADRLAMFVNIVYSNPTEHQGIPLIIATYFFAFQIYCDFSGYSDIAIGAAQIMGYNLMDNFKRPYLSESIPEFWRRWHISLSTWFRDYLYIPLGGNRVKKWRWYLNLGLVFLVSGLWHGANWTFVVWGVLHSFYYISSIWIQDITRKLYIKPVSMLKIRLQKIINIFITFHLVCFAWIFFRANSISDAFVIIKNICIIDLSQLGLNIIGTFEFLIAFSLIISLIIVDIIQERWQIRQILSKQPVYVRWAAYFVIVMTITIFGVFSSPQEFIYFQF